MREENCMKFKDPQMQELFDDAMNKFANCHLSIMVKKPFDFLKTIDPATKAEDLFIAYVESKLEEKK
jgi:hypothetical protein